MKLTKSIYALITISFLLYSSSLIGQKVYEYAVVEFLPDKRILTVSVSGGNYEISRFKWDDMEGDSDVRMALDKLVEMNKEGWEVFQATSEPIKDRRSAKDYIWYLRREMKD